MNILLQLSFHELLLVLYAKASPSTLFSI